MLTLLTLHDFILLVLQAKFILSPAALSLEGDHCVCASVCS